MTYKLVSDFTHRVAIITYAGNRVVDSSLLAERVYEPNSASQKQYTLINPLNRHFQTLTSFALPFAWNDGTLPTAIKMAAIAQFLFVSKDTFFLANRQGVWFVAKGKALLIDKSADKVSDLLFTDGQLFVSSDDGVSIYYLNSLRLNGFIGVEKPVLWSLTKQPHSNTLIAGSFGKEAVYEVTNERYRQINVVPNSGAKTQRILPYYGGCWFPNAQVNVNPLGTGVCTIDAKGNAKHVYIDNVIFQTVYDSSKQCVYLAGYGSSKLYRLNKNLSVDTLCDGSDYKMDGMLGMVIDKQANVVVSNSPQPAIYKNGRYEPSSLFPKKFWGADRDYQGNLWFACGDTVFFNNYKKWTPVVAMNPLHTAISIKCYFDRYVLIGTINGLTILDLKQWYAHQKVITFSFDESNGFIEGECRQNGFLIDDDSTVLLPHDLGIIHFDPRIMTAYSSNEAASFSVDKTSVKEGEEWQSIAYQKQPIIFQSEQRSIRIQFAIASLSNRSFINVRYRLQGLDSNWTTADNESYAIFERLSPGKYIFEVQSSLNQQDWKNHPRLSFEVKAFYWETWWFQTLIIFAFAALVAGLSICAYHWKRKMDTMQLDRKRKIAELQLETLKAKGIAHFSKNVFSRLDAMVEGTGQAGCIPIHQQVLCFHTHVHSQCR